MVIKIKPKTPIQNTVVREITEIAEAVRAGCRARIRPGAGVLRPN